MTTCTKPARDLLRRGGARILLTLVLLLTLPVTWLWVRLARALAGEPALPFGGPNNRAWLAPSVPTDAAPNAVRTVAAAVLMMAAFLPSVPSRTLAVDALEVGGGATTLLASVVHGWRRGDSWADAEAGEARRRRDAGAPTVPDEHNTADVQPAQPFHPAPTGQPIPPARPSSRGALRASGASSPGRTARGRATITGDPPPSARWAQGPLIPCRRAAPVGGPLRAGVAHHAVL